MWLTVPLAAAFQQTAVQSADCCTTSCGSPCLLGSLSLPPSPHFLAEPGREIGYLLERESNQRPKLTLCAWQQLWAGGRVWQAAINECRRSSSSFTERTHDPKDASIKSPFFTRASAPASNIPGSLILWGFPESCWMITDGYAIRVTGRPQEEFQLGLFIHTVSAWLNYLDVNELNCELGKSWTLFISGSQWFESSSKLLWAELLMRSSWAQGRPVLNFSNSLSPRTSKKI